MIRFCALLCCLLPFSSFAATDGSARTTPDYVELGEYLSAPADIEVWYTALYRLRDNFDQICGDTFCEGDYSNIQALRLSCSVQRVSGMLGRCVWAFAASQEDIDPATGGVRVAPKIWRCRLPLARGATVSALLNAWSGERPLYAPLPGSNKSAYEALGDCL
ncbi:hypothetical protein J5226_11790 [Lysobacter sp. K5869]|uniref:hypothetical protein n=1 Tax=Lysobacter sp. K5869 TaxID=2820808 RepID=UPI001C05FAE4|nr:hypothetical protein [Lysobacter sp. K5869]QWP79019.1 hypothetical protein J5226_11790 [Lysobacter sp. K5869]